MSLWVLRLDNSLGGGAADFVCKGRERSGCWGGRDYNHNARGVPRCSCPSTSHYHDTIVRFINTALSTSKCCTVWTLPTRIHANTFKFIRQITILHARIEKMNIDSGHSENCSSTDWTVTKSAQTVHSYLVVLKVFSLYIVLWKT
jgi:hypothetical protein